MVKWIAASVLGLLAAASAGGASAADLISYPTSTAEEVPIAPPGTTSSFNWDGFYTGVFGAYRHSTTAGDQFGIGIDLGVNTTFNFVLAGAEVAVEGLGGGAGTSSAVQGIGRAGLLLTDNLVAYGAAGYGLDPATPGDGDALVGGGLEYGLNSTVSVRAQYLHGLPVSGDDPNDQVTLGAQFHF